MPLLADRVTYREMKWKGWVVQMPGQPSFTGLQVMENSPRWWPVTSGLITTWLEVLRL